MPGTLRSLLVLPLAEELVFRGALLRLLRPLGEHPANLCQAVLFAALHGTLTENEPHAQRVALFGQR
ncbi:CPBP family intramembrane glutamic endopeptidase, partial [Faecalibacterium sp. DFI.5.82]|uniref:CPBP family intramembrane glutamic endopeptidase n=1 Tax=Faecalibacterium sp. DFI.5.82 TaxID=3031725 RepID=UPI0023AFFE72